MPNKKVSKLGLYLPKKIPPKELFSITGPFELIYKQTIVVNIKKEIIIERIVFLFNFLKKITGIFLNVLIKKVIKQYYIDLPQLVHLEDIQPLMRIK